MAFAMFLIQSTANAQALNAVPDGGCAFLMAGFESQTSPALKPDLNSEIKAACTVRTPALTAKEKLHYMLRSTYERNSVLFSFAGAGIKQARDSTPEWGQGMEGYGRRLASAFGHKIVKRNIQFTIGSLMREDPRYFCSESSGIWRRSMYAASRTFVSNKDGGGIRPGYSKFAATFGGAFISRQWHPERKRNINEYLISTAISIGLDTAKNVFNEFWPDLKRLMNK